MKKIILMFVVLPICAAYGTEDSELTKVRTWSMEALAQTIEESMGQISEDALVAVGQFAIEKNGEFSAYDLMETCSAKGMSESESVSFFTAAVDNHNNAVSNNGNKRSNHGCNIGYDLAIDKNDCTRLYGNNPTELESCKKCIDKVGTYEFYQGKGRCFIEVDGWYCTGKGWRNGEENNKRDPCPTEWQYSGCRLIRRYIVTGTDRFCDPSTAIQHTGSFPVAGCGNHTAIKHPPFCIEGGAACEKHCSVPLADNTDWRVPYTKGATLKINLRKADGTVDCKYGSFQMSTTDWCLPNPNASPYNKNNEPCGDTHYTYPLHVDKNNKAGIVVSPCKTGEHKHRDLKTVTYVNTNSTGYKAYRTMVENYNANVKKSGMNMTTEECNNLNTELNTALNKIKTKETAFETFRQKMHYYSSKKFQGVQTSSEQKSFAKIVTDWFSGITEEQKSFLVYNADNTMTVTCSAVCHGWWNKKRNIDDDVKCTISGIGTRTYTFDDICDGRGNATDSDRVTITAKIEKTKLGKTVTTIQNDFFK